MNKKIIAIIAAAVVLVAVVAGGAYFYIKWQKSRGGATLQDILKNLNKGILPSIETNPLENKPDINPASAANPIKDIKTNPF